MHLFGKITLQATAHDRGTVPALSGVRIGVDANARRVTPVECGNVGTADE